MIQQVKKLAWKPGLYPWNHMTDRELLPVFSTHVDGRVCLHLYTPTKYIEFFTSLKKRKRICTEKSLGILRVLVTQA